MSSSISRPLPLADTPIVVLLTPDEAHEIDVTRAIFRDYAGSLNIDLRFQDFDSELADLPGEYSEPRGTLLLALVDPANVKEEAGRQAPILHAPTARWRTWQGAVRCVRSTARTMRMRRK